MFKIEYFFCNSKHYVRCKRGFTNCNKLQKIEKIHTLILRKNNMKNKDLKI